jgi:hypothetical protein
METLTILPPVSAVPPALTPRDQPAMQPDSPPGQEILDSVGIPDQHTNLPNNEMDAKEPPVETGMSGRKRAAGRAVGVTVLREGVGIVIDAATMAAGIPLVAREVAGSGVDTAINRLGQEKSETKHSRLHHLGHYAGMMAVAMTAQKIGPGIIEHLAANLNHGAGHIAVPLASKVGAIAGFNSFIKRAVTR